MAKVKVESLISEFTYTYSNVLVQVKYRLMAEHETLGVVTLLQGNDYFEPMTKFNSWGTDDAFNTWHMADGGAITLEGLFQEGSPFARDGKLVFTLKLSLPRGVRRSRTAGCTRIEWARPCLHLQLLLSACSPKLSSRRLVVLSLSRAQVTRTLPVWEPGLTA